MRTLEGSARKCWSMSTRSVAQGPCTLTRSGKFKSRMRQTKGLVNEFGARAIEMKESFEVATLFAGIDRVDPATRDDISTVLAHGLWVPLAWNLGPGQ